MEKIDFDKYNIHVLGYFFDYFSWECSCFGARAKSDRYYKTEDYAMAACKRWIKKNGVKP